MKYNIIMKIRHLKTLVLITVMGTAVTITSCKKNLVPLGGQLTTADVYKDFKNYKPVLAKLYTSFALSGQAGPAGNPDVIGIDEGFSNYLREYFNMQELTTDEAQIVWNDGTVHNLHDMNWNNQNEFIRAMYDRIFYEISLDNEFIRQTSDAKLSSNGIAGSDLALAKQYRADARFLRALAYYHALDIFGNVPFVTENDNVGVFFPKQIQRADLFKYVESELIAIDGDLGAPRFEYGRADKAAAWTLLAKLYLNAKVYTGTDRSTDAITYASKVIAAGYTLEPHFKNMFLADNDKSNEMIFPIESDGVHTQGYGGMTYLIHAQVGGLMDPVAFGIKSGGWSGFRTTKQYVSLFSDISGNTDKRALFFTNGQNLDIKDEFTFTDGYAIQKWRNVTSTGAVGTDITGNFPDTDFPLFRLADVYLMYAEAVLRGGTGGSTNIALGYINEIRTRAYDGSTTGNITSGQLTLPFILDERGRELLFECTRRTDLIRFGKFTTADYLWAWKGGAANGTGVEDFRNLMPIPSTDMINNPTLKQNQGY
ncbi:MAG TPA: RagB/SusD family nutrient uptake outer membrane protein [Mucilaginibacter sp.]|nr:RagB/SusD family nutrient uptake outer membrane protein [Mucilaginibacter sp.]